jgi:osmotically-inducible protein OsmY
MTLRTGAALALAVSLLGGCAGAAVECTSADCHLEHAVLDRLNESAALKGDHLSVQCFGSVVYLHGIVDTFVEFYMAEEIAAKTPGVTKVVNALGLANTRL